MSWMFALVGVGLLAVGFVGGLVTFKRSLHWCAMCGTTLTCPVCAARRLAAGGRRASAGAAR